MTERSRQGGKRQQVEIVLASLKRIFGIGQGNYPLDTSTCFFKDAFEPKNAWRWAAW